MHQIVELLSDDSNPQACQQALASLSVYLTNQGFPTEQAMVRTISSTLSHCSHQLGFLPSAPINLAYKAAALAAQAAPKPAAVSLPLHLASAPVAAAPQPPTAAIPAAALARLPIIDLVRARFFFCAF